MRTISAKPTSSRIPIPVKPTKLGTKMKADVKVGTKTDNMTPGPFKPETSCRDSVQKLKQKNLEILNLKQTLEK